MDLPTFWSILTQDFEVASLYCIKTEFVIHRTILTGLEHTDYLIMIIEFIRFLKRKILQRLKLVEQF